MYKQIILIFALAVAAAYASELGYRQYNNYGHNRGYRRVDSHNYGHHNQGYGYGHHLLKRSPLGIPGFRVAGKAALILGRKKRSPLGIPGFRVAGKAKLLLGRKKRSPLGIPGFRVIGAAKLLLGR